MTTLRGNVDTHLLAHIADNSHRRAAAIALLVPLLAFGCRSAAPAHSTVPAASAAPHANGASAGSALAEATPTSANALGDTWTRPGDGAAMVYVPSGEFEMGSTFEQTNYARALCRESVGVPAAAICTAGSFANEKPAHRVALDGFWIDRTEVTNGQYQRCVTAGACLAPVETGSYTRDSYYGDPTYHDYPVIWVTQQQAIDYCTWVGARLPTEAEWEYAARGRESRLFPWGDEFDGTRLNYCDASCATGVKDEALVDGYPETAPVGSFPTGISWCGALDMAGNVREWVADWYGYYSGERQVNPAGPSDGDSHIPRGGCWLDRPDDTRCANRGENTVDYSRHKVGFRCAANAQLPSP